MLTPQLVLLAGTLTTLIGLALILIYRALAGHLPMRGLLSESATERPPAGAYSPARAQLLVIAGLCAAGVLARVGAPQAGDRDLGSAFAVALAISNLIYLRSKIRDLGLPRWLSRR